MAGFDASRSAAGKYNPWLIVAIISIPTFMEVLDTAIANVALNYIAGGLSISNDQATWVVTSYLVANAIIIPLSGWLSDTIGRKRYFVLSIVLFTVSSLACGLAPNLSVLVLARLLQGIGGGGLAPSMQSMLADTFPPEKRGAAFGAFGFVTVCGPVFGPSIGGWITDNISWHWVFLINVPIGILSVILVQIFVDEPKALATRRARQIRQGLRVDIWGFALVALALGCLEVTLDRGQREDWFASPLITTMAVLSAIGFVGLIFRELTTDNPVIDLRLLATRNFAICFLIMTTGGTIIFGSTQLIPQLLQEVMGYTATDAGLAITAGGIATVLMMPLVGALTDRVDVRYLLGAAMVIEAFALFNLAHLSPQLSFRSAAIARLYQAIGLPLLFVPIIAASYVGLKPSQTSQASALLNVARNLGGTLGISTAQTLLQRQEQVHQSQLVEGLNGLNPNYTAWMSDANGALGGAAGSGAGGIGQAPLAVLYQQAQQQATILSFLDVFHILAIFVVIVAPVVLLLRKAERGARAGGH